MESTQEPIRASTTAPELVHMPDQPGDDVFAAPSATSNDVPGIDDDPASKQGQPQTLTEELRAEIVRQVEFYFSDANLPTDDFMLKQIRRTAEGWVNIKIIADFRKMKKLTKKLDFILQSLRTSQELELSPDEKSVRRLAPLPNVDLSEVRQRTVIADNLPDKPTIEYVMDLFSKAGTVAMVRIRKENQPEPLLTKGLKGEYARSFKTYALVEYTTPEEAGRAVELLHEPDNWRTGLRVRLLLPTENNTSTKGWKKEPLPTNNTGTNTKPNTTASSSVVGSAAESAAAEPAEPVVLKKAAQPWQARRRTPVSGGEAPLGGTQLQHIDPNSASVSPSPSSSGLQALSLGPSGGGQEAGIGIGGKVAGPSGPRMPDGTRGFTFGRGRSLEHPLL